MGAALDGMAPHGLAVPAGRAADQAFHHAILEATGNAPPIGPSSSIAASVTWTTIHKQRRRALPRDPLPEHRALHEAIVSGVAALARARMTELIRLALADTALAMGA